MVRRLVLWLPVALGLVSCASVRPMEPASGSVMSEPGRLSWGTLESLILNGSAEQVAMSHSGVVLVSTRDGRTYWALQPSIDAALRAVERSSYRESIQLALE